MQDRPFISARAFCTHHHIEISFLHSLHDYGLLEAREEQEDYLLLPEQVAALEKLVRLHYDLHINLEGIDAIYHLLQRLEAAQEELGALRARLRRYEDPAS